MPRHDKSSLSLATAGRSAEFGLMAPATGKECARGSFNLHCGVALCGDRQCAAKSPTQPRAILFRNLRILAHLRSHGNGEGAWKSPVTSYPSGKADRIERQEAERDGRAARGRAGCDSRRVRRPPAWQQCIPGATMFSFFRKQRPEVLRAAPGRKAPGGGGKPAQPHPHKDR